MPPTSAQRDRRGAGDSFPQLLCDSYANRTPRRIPGNYWRELSPFPGGAQAAYVTGRRFAVMFQRLSLLRQDVYEAAADADCIA